MEHKANYTERELMPMCQTLPHILSLQVNTSLKDITDAFNKHFTTFFLYATFPT